MIDPAILAAARRPLGPGRFVWLASYPKSGNTWIRAIITALGTHPHLFTVDQLESGAQPFNVASSITAYGLDSRWLNAEETDRLRTSLLTDVSWFGDNDTETPIFRKTHEVYRSADPGHEPFPATCTRAAILVVRDPRDVACSFAPFFGVDLDAAIDTMAKESWGGRSNPALCQTEQPWGTWSSQIESWLAPDVPFPVHLVRYEDLAVDAVATLEPVLAAVGLDCTREQLALAVEQTRFERLKESERQRGFRETSPKTESFFRSGRSGAWREVLDGGQVATIEHDHRPMMDRLGYESTTEVLVLAPLPAHLGLRVRLGEVPASLEGSRSPKPWISTTDSSTIVRFGKDRALKVDAGSVATLQWPADSDDVNWVIQGWAVTLATLQRGEVSLHASTIAVGGEVIALAGRQGAGKSTTSVALQQRGHRILVDDTTLLRFEDGAVSMTPYSRNVHLLRDSADALGLDFDELPRLAGGRIKVSFSPEEPPVEPRRIDRVIVLEPADDCSDVSLVEVRGVDKVSTLGEHMARRSIAPAILGHQRYFELLTSLAQAVPVFVLSRPTSAWSLDEVVNLIEVSARG